MIEFFLNSNPFNNILAYDILNTKQIFTLMYLKTYHTIKEIPSSASSLFKQYEELSLFLGKHWFELFEQYFLSAQKSRFIVVFDDSHQAILLILLQQIHSKELTTVSNFYTACFSPFIRKNLSENNIKQAYALLISDYLLANPIYSLEIKPVLLHSNENDLFIQTLKQHHFIIDCYDFFGNWSYELKGLNYQEYYKQRPSRLKNTIKRKTNKLSKTNSCNIQIYSHIEEIQAHIKEYEQIYQLSWKTEEASAEFIRQFMLDYAATGHSRLAIAYINGHAAASQFWLVHNQSALIYKLAYDPQYKDLSIGSILTAHIMEYVIDIDGVKKLDYLTGDDVYKQDWMNKRQQFSAFIAYNTKTIPGLFQGVKFLIKKTIKRILKL